MPSMLHTSHPFVQQAALPSSDEKKASPVESPVVQAVYSPVRHLLGTNAVPSDPDLVALRATLSMKRKDVDRLDVEITRTAALLSKLVQERRETCAFIEAHRPLVSPARHMPREIWEEIFVHCLPDDTYVPPAINSSPLLLSRVCRAWRKVSQSTPRLWCSIAVSISKQGCQPSLSMINTWLARSGSNPLSLSLHHEANASDDALAVLEIFVSVFSRWKNIHLALNGLSYKALDVGDHPPILETGDIYSSSDVPLPLVIHSAQRLRSFTWSVGSGGSGLRAMDSGTPAWPNLTSLCLNCDLSPNDALETLRHCPKLVECCIGMWESSEDVVTGSTLVLPELSSLEISTHRNLGRFLDHLTLPLLHSVDIMYDPELPDVHWALSELPALLTRSSCSLKRFKILHNTITGAELTDFLQNSMSSLVELGVYNAANDDRRRNACISQELLRLLTYRPDPSSGEADWTCLAPQLEGIEIAFGCLSAADGALASMLESRWNCPPVVSSSPPAVRLQRVRVSLPSNHVEDIRRLEQLRMRGLDLDLRLTENE